MRSKILAIVVVLFTSISLAQDKVIENMIAEAENNSQLEALAHHLLDVIGPKLVGTPQMKNAHDWVTETYTSWGIEGRLEQWGQWQGWERGITHIDMVSPRLETLQGMSLAWSASTPEEGTTAGIALIPEFKDQDDFHDWLKTINGKFVMVSMNQPTGRPDYNWEEWATEASFEKMKKDRDSLDSAWRENINNSGYSYYGVRFNEEGFDLIEEAGAVGIIASRWSRAFGANKIFSTYTKTIPTIDLEIEDYGMLYRLAENNHDPVIKVVATSKDLGAVPTYNSFGEIKGTEKPDEYVMLSAHLDTWDGATGATDNGSGTIIMMEAMRLLKKYYPNPKRTILAGHWGSEEQGLNGSRAFVEDNPKIVKGLHALFNQDNGTGRIKNIDGSGFIYAYEFINRWLQPVPKDIKDEIETEFPGIPSTGGSDHSSLVAAGAPGFRLTSHSWSYWNYTWHTNLDTYDKLVFDDLRNNAILVAIMVYMACEDDKKFPRDQRVMPISERTGVQLEWPSPRPANRKGRLDD